MGSKQLIAFILVACLGSSFLTAKFMAPATSNAPEKESAFDRIQHTRTLRCGYTVIRSMLEKDMQTGQLSGPAFDIVTKMADNLKLKVEWTTETSPATASEDLKNGRFDMLCVPIATNSARGQVMNSSRKAFFMWVNFYVHKDETRSADDLSWANDPNVKLSAIDGMGATTFMGRVFPKARIVSLPEMSPLSDVFLQVATKKADATVMLALDADLFLKSNPGSIKVGNTKPIYVSSQSFWMPKGDEKLKGMIDAALDEIIYDGSIDRILSKYEPERGRYFLRVHPDYED